jgi:hypothetical protein
MPRGMKLWIFETDQFHHLFCGFSAELVVDNDLNRPTPRQGDFEITSLWLGDNR